MAGSLCCPKIRKGLEIAMRQIIVGQRFYTELNILIPSQKEADEFVESAKLFFLHNPDSGEQIHASVHTKYVPDNPRSRDLAIYYTKDDFTITLQSIKVMPWHFPEELAGL
jgi:hypothetical protein